MGRARRYWQGAGQRDIRNFLSPLSRDVSWGEIGRCKRRSQPFLGTLCSGMQGQEVTGRGGASLGKRLLIREKEVE